MPVYDSPVYPSIAIHFGDSKRARAVRGRFNIADEDVTEFEKWAKNRPHYKITKESGERIETPKAEVEPEPSVDETDMPDDDLKFPEDMTVAELKEALATKGLATSGNRADLIARLITEDDDAAIAAADEAADAEDA